MGKHYTPKAHLNRFHVAGTADHVWMFDKIRGAFTEASTKKVAQEPGYYSEEVEAGLRDIELDGNKVVSRVMNREPLDNKQRSSLALYMQLMATRGPRLRRLLTGLLPAVLKNVAEESMDEIRAKVADHGLSGGDQDRVVAEIVKRYGEAAPAQVQELIRSPFWNQETADAVLNMWWHIIRAPERTYFVTSDTPAHIFDGSGLATWGSELTFTLSKEFALIGAHQRIPGLSWRDATTQEVKEVNRRIISHAERFVFSPESEPWIATVANNSTPYLRRFEWAGACPNRLNLPVKGNS